MKFSNLLKNISDEVIKVDYNTPDISSRDPEITSIHYRAQDVRKGGLFVAVKGFAADGNDYIDLALTKGAVVIVTEKQVKKNAIILQVKNSRKALSMISACFFHAPSERLIIIGITGTNGKTTTAFLMESILQKAGFETGVIGTINYRYCGKTFDNPVTTPESSDLHMILSQMLKHGVTHVIIEVSSHALDLHRIEHCWLDIGVFTNLTRDHLDYHKDMDSYWACKKKMFLKNLAFTPKKNNAAVINCDDPRGKELYNIYTGKKYSVGLLNGNMIMPGDLKEDLKSIKGTFFYPGGTFDFNTSLVGRHNVHNIASAVGAAVSLGINPDTISSGIEDVKYVPGRLEPVPNSYNRFVYVDYAHTPDALEQVLSTLKQISKKKLICVFGCGGNRDKGKRPEMGKIAESFADITIVTSDNPRDEDPMEIINHIVNGMSNYTKKYFVHKDRKNAIELAVNLSKPGDTILIAGKGSESYQILKSGVIHFDDREETEKILNQVCRK